MRRDAPTPLLPLFAYGTLRDPEYQLELFGQTFPMRRAQLAGYVVRVTEHGYLAAAEWEGGVVDGALVALDAAAYDVADAWEDLDVYERLEVDARDGAGVTSRAYLYARPRCAGPLVTDGRLTDRSRADVIADIRQFRASTRRLNERA
jgi:gamma-glutamylcyclotransferase (GGCT)/AIG2-like uncharacterized protein YtfP